MSQREFRNLLHSSFLKKKERNASYSLRSFARYLNCRSSVLCEILNGKRSVTPLFANKVLERLEIGPQERALILQGIRDRRTKAGKKQPIEQRVLLRSDEISFRITSEWQYFAILALTETKNFSGFVKDIANRLNISKSVVEKSLEDLIAVQCLNRDKGGRIMSTGRQYTTTDEIPNAAVRLHHLRGMDLAAEALDLAIDLRDFGSITMSIDKEKISKAKDLLRGFRDQLAELLETGERTEVYRFNWQLFPITKQKKETSKSSSGAKTHYGN